MGTSQSNHHTLPQKLNHNIHSNLDIGICGYDLNNGQMKPTKCSDNMYSNKSNDIKSVISNLNIPKLPINNCVPLGPLSLKTGVQLKKDLNNKLNENKSNFKLSTCSHNYKTISDIPKEISMTKITQSFIDMNKSNFEQLRQASHYGITNINHTPAGPSIQGGNYQKNILINDNVLSKKTILNL